MGPDESPGVTNAGTDTAAVLNFALQQGKQGEAGKDGSAGPAGPNEVTAETATVFDGLLKGNGANVQAAEAGQDYAVPAVAVTVSLPAAGWVDNSQAVGVFGVTADSLLLVSPDLSSAALWAETTVLAVSQGDGTVTFSAAATPSGDLTAQILIVG